MLGGPSKVLADYMQLLTEIGPASFRQRFNTSMLVMLRQSEAAADSTREFHTALISRDALKAAMRAENEKALVFPLRKRQNGAFSDQISVGRTRSADICLPFRDVSKFHAYFRIVPQSGRVTLTDAGATNGTMVSGRVLKPSEAALLENGMTLRFGACELNFYTPDGFREFVAGRLPSLGPDTSAHVRPGRGSGR